MLTLGYLLGSLKAGLNVCPVFPSAGRVAKRVYTLSFSLSICSLNLLIIFICQTFVLLFIFPWLLDAVRRAYHGALLSCMPGFIEVGRRLFIENIYT